MSHCIGVPPVGVCHCAGDENAPAVTCLSDTMARWTRDHGWMEFAGGYTLDVNELDIEIAARPLKLLRT